MVITRFKRFFFALLSLLAIAHGTPLNAGVIDSLYIVARKAKVMDYQIANRLIVAMEAEGCTDSLYVFTKKSNPNEMQAVINICMAYHYYNHDSFVMAVKAAEESARFAEKWKEKESGQRKKEATEILSDAYSYIASGNSRLGKSEEAISITLRGIQVDSLLGDKDRLSSDYNNLAAICIEVDKLKDAKKYILRAIELAPKESLPIRYAIAAEIFNKLGETQQALDYAEKAYQLEHLKYDAALKESNKNAISKAHIKVAKRMSQMADVYRNMKEFSQAEKYYRNAIDILSEEGEKNSLCITYKQLGLNSAEMGNEAEAISLLKKGEAIARDNNCIFTLQQICESLGDLLKDRDSKAAYEYIKEAKKLSDQLKTEKSDRLTAEYAAAFDAATKEQNSFMAGLWNWIDSLGLLGKGLLFLALASVCCFFPFFTIRNRRKHTVKKVEDSTDNANNESVDSSSKNAEDTATDTKPKLKVADQQFLDKITKEVLSSMGKRKLNVESLADKMCMSRSQLTRKMTALTNMSPNAYINNIRLEKACELLKNSDMNVNEIALACGFDDPHYFNRLFKQQFGITPLLYRNQQE